MAVVYLNISSFSLLAFRVFAYNLMGVGLHIKRYFSLSAFKNLSLTFDNLIIIDLGVDSLDASLLVLIGLPGPDVCYFLQVMEVFSDYFFK